MPKFELSLPETVLEGDKWGTISANGLELYYVQKGQGENLILLHGGLGNSDQWVKQFDVFAEHFCVTALESRGHGRSNSDDKPLSIHLIAEDVKLAMHNLGIERASIVGWSDGGNVGLDLALNYPDKIDKLVTFGANYAPHGAKPNAGENEVLGEYVGAMAAQYAAFSKTPNEFEAFSGQVFNMWGTEPNFTEHNLKRIRCPVLVMHGEYEEAIKTDHSEEMAATLPFGEYYLMKNVSHFGLWQDPDGFNKTVLEFLNRA